MMSETAVPQAGPLRVPFWWEPARLDFGTGPISGFFAVVIIGGGLAGIALAYWLARLGCKSVLLLEKGEGLCQGASGRNGGHIVPGTMDFGRHVELYGPEIARAWWDLEEEGAQLVRALAEEHAIECELTETGTVSLALDEEGLRQVYSVGALLEEHELPIDVWDAQLCREQTGSSAFLGGIYRRNGGQFHPERFALGLAREALGQGVEIRVHTDAIQVIEHDDVLEVETNQGNVFAQHVAYATNWEIGRHVPRLRDSIQPVRGQVIVTEPVDRICHVGCGTFAGFTYWFQNPEGRFILGGMRNMVPGAEVDISNDAEVNPHIEQLLERFLRQELRVSARAARGWSGIMGFSPRPIVGILPLSTHHESVIGGLGGHGMPSATILARELAQLILGGEAELLPDVFQPGLERFGGGV